MRLVLVRHGESTANVSGEVDTRHPGRPLTERGQAQAVAAASALRAFAPDRLFASTFTRAQQTAALLGRELGLEVQTLAGAQEIDSGEFDGGIGGAAHVGFVEVFSAWMAGDLEPNAPGAENGHDFLARYDAAVDEAVTASEQCAMIVSHGAAIRTWVCRRAEPNAELELASSRLLNTGYIALRPAGTQWQIESWSLEPAGGVDAVTDAALDPTAAAPRPASA